jgi:cytochrome bd-type quinol oxidase subunit 2
MSTITLLASSLGSKDPVTVIFALVNVALTLLGMVFLVLLLYAGVVWVLARGNEEQIERSKHTIRRALIGLAIVLSAYGTTYIFYIYAAF